MTVLNRARVRFVATRLTLLVLAVLLATCCAGGFPYHYVDTSCRSRLIWSDSRLLLVVRVTETHVRVTPFKWLRVVVQWNLGAGGSVDGHYRQYLIVCEARDGRVESTVCDEGVSDFYLTPYRGEVYAEQFTGMNKPTVPYRWNGGGFERAGDDMTATLQAQRFDGAPGIEAGWQADDKFNISSFRESRPPLTGLGKDLRATATITKWCEGANWNGPLRVRFEVSLPNGASKVIELDMARRSSTEAVYEALPASR